MEGENDNGHWEDGKMGLFSVMGHRSPHLEGKPGSHSKLIKEIHDHFSKVMNKGLQEQ